MIGTKIYWNKCFHKDQYSILGSLSADKCLEECIISGSQCKAVAYERLRTVCRLYHDVDVSNVEKDSYTCVGSNIVYRNSFTKVCMYCINKTFLITFFLCDPVCGVITIHISPLISRAINGNGARPPEKITT
ncbi:hypothetical protein DPMN_009182 [Dreissena polymorpha]|uniref:Apple domain-containing protein n=1 Tax=Dreissena polymorpha TaxID=45954 RepID=A0A9D4MZT3_DREPO|nr:hypothetical protein DPMN_009182 [Dreissena polymorpha]